MIAIPNMGKPNSCGLCQLCLYDSRIANGYCMFFHRTVNMMELDKACPLIEIDDELIQEELTKMAWCKGFSDGYTKAQETISNYIKRMGFAVEIPNAHELYVRLKGEEDE